MLRFLLPLLLMFAPQWMPRVIKFVRAVWLLHKDGRVNILLKLLLPLAIGYAVLFRDFIPDWLPYGLGRYDDIIIFGLALFIFWKLCPPAVVREHMGEPPPPRPEDRDPDSVVDGEARPTDDREDQRGG